MSNQSSRGADYAGAGQGIHPSIGSGLLCCRDEISLSISPEAPFARGCLSELVHNERGTLLCCIASAWASSGEKGYNTLIG